MKVLRSRIIPFLVLFFSLLAASQAQKSLIHLCDSSYEWLWSAPAKGWDAGYFRHYMVYDENNNLASDLEQYHSDMGWINNILKNYTYDSDGRMATELYQQWQNEDWVSNTLVTFSYDPGGNLQSRLWQTAPGSTWINVYLNTYHYDESNLITTEIDQSWHNGGWLNSVYRAFTYNGNFLLDNVITETWTNNMWVTYSRSLYAYINSNCSEELQQSWNGNAWVSQARITYAYDDRNNLLSAMHQDASGMDWKNSFQEAYSYDADDFLAGLSSKTWTDDGTAVWYGDSLHYYCRLLVGLDEMNPAQRDLFIYPNPADSRITVCASGEPMAGTRRIWVFSTRGELIMTSVYAGNRTDLDISGLAPGIYQVRASDGRTSQVSKFMKR